MTLIPFPGADINPVGKTLDKFKAIVKELDATDSYRMAGDLETVSGGLLVLHLVLDRIIAARVEMGMQQQAAG